MRLSKRMQTVADMVQKTRTVADIGCDHAYVSIYLIQRRLAQHVIAMDINQGPLAIARENIRQAGMEGQIATRLSDGTEKLLPGEADTLVIAGMGGDLIIRILDASPEVTKACRQLILQPQSEIVRVRAYLRKMGFEIVKEDMILDEGKYYVVLRCEQGMPGEGNPVADRYGKELLLRRHPVMGAYLRKQLKKYEAILEDLQINSPESAERMDYIRNEIIYIKEALSYYEL
ncbi:class I SAM-dependent methyltransferase [Anaerolentibacter hominis]|uniref:tRNA (adenine(22)-N(1))-methyltransferase n=1 Tax=Anaerolentibacter hominis TaxID=3079009 RepID=UPI0031B8137B